MSERCDRKMRVSTEEEVKAMMKEGWTFTCFGKSGVVCKAGIPDRTIPAKIVLCNNEYYLARIDRSNKLTELEKIEDAFMLARSNLAEAKRDNPNHKFNTGIEPT